MRRPYKNMRVLRDEYMYRWCYARMYVNIFILLWKFGVYIIEKKKN